MTGSLFSCTIFLLAGQSMLISAHLGEGRIYMGPTRMYLKWNKILHFPPLCRNITDIQNELHISINIHKPNNQNNALYTISQHRILLPPSQKECNSRFLRIQTMTKFIENILLIFMLQNKYHLINHVMYFHTKSIWRHKFYFIFCTNQVNVEIV